MPRKVCVACQRPRPKPKFGLPTNKYISQLWLDILHDQLPKHKRHRHSWVSHSDSICLKHFHESSYIRRNGNGSIMLKRFAVPIEPYDQDKLYNIANPEAYEQQLRFLAELKAKKSLADAANATSSTSSAEAPKENLPSAEETEKLVPAETETEEVNKIATVIIKSESSFEDLTEEPLQPEETNALTSTDSWDVFSCEEVTEDPLFQEEPALPIEESSVFPCGNAAEVFISEEDPFLVQQPSSSMISPAPSEIVTPIANLKNAVIVQKNLNFSGLPILVIVPKTPKSNEEIGAKKSTEVVALQSDKVIESKIQKSSEEEIKKTSAPVEKVEVELPKIPPRKPKPPVNKRFHCVNRLVKSNNIAADFPKLQGYRFYRNALAVIEEQRKKIYTLQKARERKTKKVKSLAAMVKLLKEQNAANEKTSRFLESFNENDELRAVLQRRLDGRKIKFTPSLRMFALTLHSLSCKAYIFVRDSFGKEVLPHPKSICKWLKGEGDDGYPGLTKEDIERFKRMKGKERLRKPRQINVLSSIQIKPNVEVQTIES